MKVISSRHPTVVLMQADLRAISNELLKVREVLVQLQQGPQLNGVSSGMYGISIPILINTWLLEDADRARTINHLKHLSDELLSVLN